MNTAEKIAALEALLVRVQQRAGEPRQKRAPAAVFAVPSQPVESAAAPVAEPPKVEAPKVEPPKVEAPAPAVVAAPVPPATAAKQGASPSGSYVAKGGMSEELPDFTLEEEEEELDESQQDAELVIEQDAASSDADGEAEELDIPSRPSITSLKAVDVRAPIELDTTTDEEIEIDRAPLASAVPSAMDEAAARELERLPGAQSTSESGLELEVSAASIAPPPAMPLITPKPVAVPAPIAPAAVAAPPAPIVAPPPVVPAPPAVVQPPAPPVVAAPIVAPPPVAPPPVVAPPVTAAPIVAPPAAVASKPAATAAAPVVHEAAPLPDAPAFVAEGAIAAPAPTTFAGMLRRSLALRIRG